jgi:subtilisin family serine protease
MTITRSLGILFAAVLLGLAPAARAQHGGGDGEIPHQFLVRLVPGQAVEPVAATYGAGIAGRDPERRIYLLTTPDTSSDRDTEHAMRIDPRIELLENNHRHQVPEAVTQSFFVRVARPDYTDQPGAAAIGLGAAHELTTGAGVTVAILDSGVSPHADLPNLLPGYNFVDGNTDTSDARSGLDTNGNGIIDEAAGHGTMVAGLVALAAPAARILPVRVLDSDGAGNSFAIAEGLYYAAAQGALVVNMSLVAPADSPFVRDALSSLAAAGVTVVIAVGNDGLSTPAYPAAVPGVLAIASTDSLGVHSTFSDFGSYVALSAPGESAVGPFPDGSYSRASGVSFSAPLVAGTAALLVSARPGITPADVRQFLVSSARNIDALNPTYTGLIGAGLVAADAAVRAADASADLDGNGVVNVQDFLLFLRLFAAADPRADTDGDGAVGVRDFLAFLQIYATGH